MKGTLGGHSARSGTAWSRSYADSRTRKEQAKFSTQGRGIAESPIGYSTEQMRAAVEAETCPFCGAGPYKSLGNHTNRAHGVSADELRDLTGLERICSQDLSDSARERFVSRADFAETQRRANAAALQAGAQVAAAAASAAPRRALQVERDPVIAHRAAAGEVLKDIAADFGITYNAVLASLKRSGTAPSLEQTNQARRERLAAYRADASQSHQAALLAERERRVTRFVELGGDWSAVRALAEELGQQQRNVVDYLKKCGVDLPDGRAVSDKRGGPRPAKLGIPNHRARAAGEAQVAEIRRLSQRGVSQSEIAKSVGVGQSTVSRILAGRYVSSPV